MSNNSTTQVKPPVQLVAPSGADIRAWRARQSLSQGALAALVGVSKDTVLNWENGHTAAPPMLALALAHLAQIGGAR